MKTLFWKIAYKHLTTLRLFCGIYDAKNGNESFMHGVCNVMEYIAFKAGKLDDFGDMWDANIRKSKEAASMDEEKTCKTCKHLMFSDCYGECDGRQQS